MAELDAAASLATFAYLHPDYPWPLLSQPDESGPANGDWPILDAVKLAHPLIPATVRIGNDVLLKGQGRIFLVTGSNMSGKSTFLQNHRHQYLSGAGGRPCLRRVVSMVARPDRQLHSRG